MARLFAAVIGYVDTAIASIGVQPATLGDVLVNRIGGANELIALVQPDPRGKSLDDNGDAVGERRRQLPNV